jgi:hypothetical protein
MSDNSEELLDKINDLTVSEAVNQQDIKNIKEDTQEIKQSVSALAARVESYYVNNDVFYPVKTAVYGLMGGILITVLIAVLSLIIIPQIASPMSPQNKMLQHEESTK